MMSLLINTLVGELDVAHLQLSLLLFSLVRASVNSHLLDELAEATRFLLSLGELLR